jgi:hypothetical protein
MFSMLLALETSSPASPGVQGELVRLFGLHPVVAGLLVIGLTAVGSTLGSILARWLWDRVVRRWEWRCYGGWELRVSGGKSGRNWHMPLDIDIVKALKTRRYVAFKRDLGTTLSGEGIVDFTLGVDQQQPLRAAPPQATGLKIDFARRLIEMVFPAPAEADGADSTRRAAAAKASHPAETLPSAAPAAPAVGTPAEQAPP